MKAHNKLCLVVCLGLAKEVQAIIESEGWKDVFLFPTSIHCVSGRHNTYQLPTIPADLAQAEIHLLGGGCLNSSPPPSEPSRPIHTHHKQQCFEFLCNRNLVEFLQREGACLLTSGWLENWRDHVVDVWKFDQNTAHEFYKESASKLILLDTGIHADSRLKLEEMGAFTGCQVEIVPVGLDHLRLHLQNLRLSWIEKDEKKDALSTITEIRHKLSDYGIAADLIIRLAKTKSEKEIIRLIMELFEMLFAPESIVYLPITRGQNTTPHTVPQDLESVAPMVAQMMDIPREKQYHQGHDWFTVRVGDMNDRVGMIRINRVRFPQYQRHYMELAIHIAGVCNLAVHNARLYDKLDAQIHVLEAALEERHTLVTQLQDALANVKTLSGLIPICSGCKKIRDDHGYWNQLEAYILSHTNATFTHGLCPKCMDKYLPDPEAQKT